MNGLNRIDVWLMDDRSRERFSSSSRLLLSPEEMARAEAMDDEATCETFKAARCGLRTLLSLYEPGIKPAEWGIEIGEFGKPRIRLSQAAGLQFNLSHTRGLIVFAFSRGNRVGIDVERLDREINPIEVARDYFSEEESRHVSELIGMERERFLQIWTLKEALAKALGTGLGSSLSQCSFSVRESRIVVQGNLNSSLWKFHLFHPAKSCLAALAVESAEDVVFSVRAI